FQSFQIQRKYFTTAVVIFHFFIETLPAFAAQPFLFHHSINKTGNLENAVFLVFGNVFINAFGNVHQSVQPDNINRAEGYGFWSATNVAGQFIYFSIRKSHFLHLMEKALYSKDSNSVSYKSRRAFCDYGSFSEELFAVTVQKIQNFFSSIWPGN